MKIISVVLAFFFATLASAASLNQVVVFGDSLSDNGNMYEYMKHQLPLSPPYYHGRFSNGPVWVELLAAHYFPQNTADHVLNYAFGGAGVAEDLDEDDDTLFTLKREMDSYFLAHHNRADSHSLYIVWIGANNYLGMPEEADAAIQTVLTGLNHGLQRLVDAGAKHIMVLTLPNLGRIPAARDFDAQPLMSYLALQHNELLKQSLAEFAKRHADVQWILYDINPKFEHMLDEPSTYGFSNVTDTCYESMIDAPSSSSRQTMLKIAAAVKPRVTQDACTGYLFFDPVHPSALAHKIMAEQAEILLDRSGVTFHE